MLLVLQLHVNSAVLLEDGPFLVSYQRDDDFAIRVRLERVGVLEVLANDLVVVNLTVDGEGDGAILVQQRLGARVCEMLGLPSLLFHPSRHMSETYRRQQC